MPFLRQTAEGTIISLHVQPRASRNAIAGVQGGELKVRLTSPPVDGAANRLCIEFLADLFDLAKRDVQLISGETSRHKKLLLRGADIEHVKAAVSAHLSAP